MTLGAQRAGSLRLFLWPLERALFQRHVVGNLAERRGDIGPYFRDRRDNADGDQRSDETVFNGGGARLIGNEALEEIAH